MSSRRSLLLSIPALLIAALLCGLAWIPVPPAVLVTLWAASFLMLASGFARAMSKRENSYLTLAVPVVALVVLVVALVFWEEHRERANAPQPLIDVSNGAPAFARIAT
jgi:O-antigen/teichoic acid export membrane protein